MTFFQSFMSSPETRMANTCTCNFNETYLQHKQYLCCGREISAERRKSDSYMHTEKKNVRSRLKPHSLGCKGCGVTPRPSMK